MDIPLRSTRAWSTVPSWIVAPLLTALSLADCCLAQGSTAAAKQLPDFGGNPRWKAPKRTWLRGDVVRVPMDASARYCAVDVEIDGAGPFRFNVDTGASLPGAIDAELAERLDLRRVATVRNSDGTGNERRRDLVMADRLQVGDAEFHGVRLLVEDFRWVSPKGTPRTMGILGFPLFRDLLLTIDYPGAAIELRRGRLPRRPTPGVIDFDVTEGIPVVSFGVGADRYAALLDTGNPSSVTFPRSFLRLLRTTRRPRTVATGRSAYQEFVYLGAPLREPVELGGARFDRVDALFVSVFDAPLLGHGLLRNFALTFDQKRARIRFVCPDGCKRATAARAETAGDG